MSIVSEISEALSLTNKPKQLLETALDTLSEVLGIDCCWVQLVTPGSKRGPIAASRGFTPEMKREMALMDLGRFFSDEIVGLGHKIIIPNLSRYSNHDVSAFEKAGFCSLIAVPIMTYRIHGVMGLAYRVRKRFDKDFSELVTVIANLIGMALNKSMLHKQTAARKNQPGTDNSPQPESAVNSNGNQSTAVEAEEVADTGPRHQGETKGNSGDFQDHTHRMRVFRRSHKGGEPERHD